MAGEYSKFDRAEIIALMMSQGATQQEAIEATRSFEESLDKALNALAAHPFNTAAAGAPKAVVGHLHFQLRKALISAVVLSTSFAASGMALIGFPPAGVVGMAATVAAAIQQVSDQITKLSDVEVLIFEKLLVLEKAKPETANVAAPRMR